MTRLKELREQEGWTQDQLVREMHRVGATLGHRFPGRRSMITNLSRWENGRITPGPDYLQVLRQIFAVTDVELGIEGDEDVWCLPAPRADHQVAYFESLFAEHVAADNQLGSAYVGPLVVDTVRQLVDLARTARGPGRRPLVTVASQYEELLGWLNQDAGRLEAAMRHTDAACDLAVELNDSQWNAYLLMRKSNIATDAGNAPVALALVDAAAGAVPESLADLRAVVLRQKANAHALLGEADDCNEAINDALLALKREGSEPSGLASYCTPEYVAAEAGKCWVVLGDHARALDALELASRARAVPSQRDHGLALARATNAYALAGDREAACSTAFLAIGAATAARSMRVVRELRLVRGTLRSRWPKDDQSKAIVQAIGKLASGG